jgi:diadenosine tetraphosphatase ApaH/serine/threonine PP2A family protein phosphatase
MRLGIFSDIHGNLEALEAVLETLRGCSIDRYVCLGDIVGYGANPNECIDTVRRLTDTVVMGNHDHSVLGLTDLSEFNSYAQHALLWTAQHLLHENRMYLRRLPFVIRDGRYVYVHATLNRPEEWGYIFSSWHAQACLRCIDKGQICFIGHSHRPFIFDENEELLCRGGTCKVSCDSSLKYLVNVGSVGQPRDDDPRAAVCVVDEGEGTVEILRVEYDILTAQRKIRVAGLPEFLADRLARGG